MDRPTPRVALGTALRGIATSTIDISDGLLGDLGHILKASGVGATVHTAIAIELIAMKATNTWTTALIDQKTALQSVLAGGDDYELAFTAPLALRAAVAAAAQRAATPVIRIGHINAEAGLRLVDGEGQAMPNSYASFDHFA